MNEQPFISSPVKKDRFKVVVSICLAVLTAAVGWLVYRVETLPEKQEIAPVSNVQEQGETASDDRNNNGWNTALTSGRGSFKVTLPDGWGPVINDKTSDLVVLPGTTQPTVKKGDKVAINEVSGYGTDSPSVFSMVVHAKGEVAQPRGSAEEFTVGKAEDMIKGTKYTFVYPSDDFEGIGYLRLQGDRSYQYVLPLGDKELHISYSVYGSDPRNLIATVDEIVRTITIPKQ